MTINYEKNEIEMTKKESRQAGIVGSEEFEALLKLRTAFPGYKIVVKSASKSRDHLKGLTVDYMLNYIQEHDKDDHNILKEFYQLRGLDDNGKPMELAAVASYGELKMWFLDQFPEIENLKTTVDKIIDRTKKNRAARKAA